MRGVTCPGATSDWSIEVSVHLRFHQCSWTRGYWDAFLPSFLLSFLPSFFRSLLLSFFHSFFLSFITSFTFYVVLSSFHIAHSGFLVKHSNASIFSTFQHTHSTVTDCFILKSRYTEKSQQTNFETAWKWASGFPRLTKIELSVCCARLSLAPIITSRQVSLFYQTFGDIPSRLGITKSSRRTRYGLWWGFMPYHSFLIPGFLF